ncbi:hypothetical protein ACFFX0_11810 [Citricoccus parietis]|uniref:Uncharacterized protein n=1 Tax=Citricoccus parietis TaxID=592307 RepID=A0ABV5FYT9_9MICC
MFGVRPGGAAPDQRVRQLGVRHGQAPDGALPGVLEEHQEAVPDLQLIGVEEEVVGLQQVRAVPQGTVELVEGEWDRHAVGFTVGFTDGLPCGLGSGRGLQQGLQFPRAESVLGSPRRFQVGGDELLKGREEDGGSGGVCGHASSLGSPPTGRGAAGDSAGPPAASPP